MNIIEFKNIYLVLLGLLIVATLTGQPQPCDINNPEMTPTCIDACIICDVDGFTGRHESDIVGSLPDDFCTQFVHNAQWIAFQAASTSLKIRMTVSNCDMGDGLELAIYRSFDCENFTMISNCRGAGNAVPDGTSAEFETTEDLVVGQYYYLAMDGNKGDNCSWTFEVIEGSTEVAPLTFTDPIQGVDRFCPGVLQTYMTEPEIGAVVFGWTLDGVDIGDDAIPSVDLNLSAPGFYELCVTARNTCDEADPTCKTIEVYIITDTTIIDEFCENDCYEIDDNIYCETGVYTYSIALANGCDSVIILDLTEIAQPINELTLNICDGDTIYIGGTPFFLEGSYTELISDAGVCDSIVNLELAVIICNIQSSFTTSSNTCFGDANGAAIFQVDNGTAPFMYNWEHLQTDLQGAGAVLNLGEGVSIPNLPAGQLVINIEDGFGNTDILLVDIVEPTILEVGGILSDYNGYNISCNGFSDGAITGLVSGGQEAYQYAWSNGDVGATIDNLSVGTYILTVTDDLACESTAEFSLIAPIEIAADAVFVDPSCQGLETGSINVLSVSGGLEPYLYSLNSSSFSENDSYSQLSPGEYVLSIMDDNMCVYDTVSELVAPQIPMLSGTSDYIVQLACGIPLDIQLNDVDIQEISWIDSMYLDCVDCLDPTVTPLQSGTNMVVVSSVDDCVDSLQVYIEVIKDRAFYSPNIFSPNGDSHNELFSLFGGKEVASVDLHVYDRWGSKVYDRSNMEARSDSEGWDGRFKDKEIEGGVYVWKAKVLFIDGYSQIYAGDITVIR